MSLIIKTECGDIECSLMPFFKKPSIRIGEYKMPLDEFCMMATHFFRGGIFGWSGPTPESINKALANLFKIYKCEEGNKWIRRDADKINKMINDINSAKIIDEDNR